MKITMNKGKWFGLAAIGLIIIYVANVANIVSVSKRDNDTIVNKSLSISDETPDDKGTIGTTRLQNSNSDHIALKHITPSDSSDTAELKPTKIAEKSTTESIGDSANLKKQELRKIRFENSKTLMKLASAKNWEQFLELAEQVMADSDYAKHSTLTTAIADKAPKYVFEQLLGQGAVFNAPHIIRVVSLDDIHFLKMLISLGLDIHMSSSSGENAINSLVNTLASNQNFRFLLENNVAIKTGSDGIPLLTKALDKAVTRKEAVYYAYKLIQYGAEITAVDRELVEKIRNENQAAFNLIQRNIPELITD